MSESLDETVAAIREFLRSYFETFPDDGDPLDLDRTKVFVGLYAEYDDPGYPTPSVAGQVAQLPRPLPRPIDTRDPDGPVMPFHYRLAYDPEPIKFVANDQGDAEVYNYWRPSGSWFPIHLWHSQILVDPVWDDRLEMQAAGFPYADILANMSRDARTVYNQNLDKIIDRPAELPASEDGVEFIRALAMHGTYDSDGDYFSKWKPGKQNTPPLAEAVTQRYLQNSFREVTLVRGQFYVLRQNELFSEIDLLYFDERHGLNKVPYYSQKNNRYELEKYQQDQPLHDSFVFTYAAGGIEKTWRGKYPVPKHWTGEYDKHNPKGHAAVRRMIDVRRWVEGVTFLEETESKLGLRDDFDWFVEFVKGHFPHRLTIIDLKAIRRAGWDLESPVAGKLVHEMLASRIKDALKGTDDAVGGDLTKSVLDDMLKLLENPDLLVFPQGLKTGEHSRFIGGDNDFMFERDLVTGTVYMVDTLTYILNLAVGEVAYEVYEATKEMIPFIAAVSWAVVIVMGAEFLGITPGDIRTFLTKRFRDEVVDKVTEEIFKKIGQVFVVLLLDGVLYVVEFGLRDPSIFDNAGRLGLLPPGETPATQYASAEEFLGRIHMFLRGFWKGYLIDAIWDHLYKNSVDRVVDPKMWVREVREYYAVKQLYHTLDRTREIIETFENEIDGPTARRAVETLSEAAGHIARGAALLLGSLYYLPHDEAEAILKNLGIRDGKPPEPDEWAAEAHLQIAHVTDFVATTIQTLNQVEGYIDFLEEPVVEAGILFLAVFEAEIIISVENVALHVLKPILAKLKEKHVKAFIYVALLPILAAVGIALEGGIEKAWDKVVGVFKSLLGRNKDEAEFNGHLVGAMFGGFFLQKLYYGSNTDLGHYMEHNPIKGGFIWGNVKYGLMDVTLEVIFHRYAYLFDRLHHQEGDVIRGVNRIRDELQRRREGIVNDQDMGWLNKFETFHEKQKIPLCELVVMIVGMRRLLLTDLQDFLDGRYAGDLQKYQQEFDEINDITKRFGVDFHDVSPEQLPFVYHNVTSHLCLALAELEQALHLLFDPFTKQKHSWMQVLHSLGLDIGDPDKIREEITKAAKEELDGFRKKPSPQ